MSLRPSPSPSSPCSRARRRRDRARRRRCRATASRGVCPRTAEGESPRARAGRARDGGDERRRGGHRRARRAGEYRDDGDDGDGDEAVEFVRVRWFGPLARGEGDAVHAADWIGSETTFAVASASMTWTSRRATFADLGASESCPIDDAHPKALTARRSAERPSAGDGAGSEEGHGRRNGTRGAGAGEVSRGGVGGGEGESRPGAPAATGVALTRERGGRPTNARPNS